MTRVNSGVLLAIALLLGGCAANAPDAPRAASAASGAIDWRQVAAAGRVPGSDAALHALLADSSHFVRMIAGREQRYFAADGTAVFRNLKTGTIETGWWATQPSRAFGHFICSARGTRPASIDPVLVEGCKHSSDWVASADGLTRGDAYGLKGAL